MSAAEERLGYAPTSELWGEHRSRYRFAAQWVAGKRVLDVACGAGFGQDMLRAAGGCVVGVDLDYRPLRGGDQVQADAARLPLADASIDVVATFETIEHVPDARALVHELRRVLRPAGVLVLSTPNRAFGPPERHTHNPFHVQEFTAAELRALLSGAFDDVRIHGQHADAVYRFVPFLMVDADWSPAALTWKALNRLPYGIKNGLAHALTGRSWYPDEAHYRFAEDRFDGAHALVAIAR
jgi:SAM-dependent methyltransferase